MRRKDREVTGAEAVLAILARCDSVRLAFASGNEPYIVALNFGIGAGDQPALYFHCAREGRKLDMMRANPRVCFQADTSHELVTGPTACSWGMRYESVLGYGRLSEVTDLDERKISLDALMRHHGETGVPKYETPVLEATSVLRLDIETISAKRKSLPYKE